MRAIGNIFFYLIVGIFVGTIVAQWIDGCDVRKREAIYEKKIDSLERRNDSLDLELKKASGAVLETKKRIDSLLLAADALETKHYVYQRKLRKTELKYEEKIKEIKNLFFNEKDSVYIRNYFSKFFVH